MNTNSISKTVGALAANESWGMKTMSVTGTMKAAVRRLATAAVGLAVGAALLGGVLVAASGSAQAGGWTVKSVTSGGHWKRYNPWGQYFFDWAAMFPASLLGISNQESANHIGAYEYETAATPQITFEWVHADPANPAADPAPDTLRAKITTSTSSWWDCGYIPIGLYASVSGCAVGGASGTPADSDPLSGIFRGGPSSVSSKIVTIKAGKDIVTHDVPEMVSHIQVNVATDFPYGGITWGTNVNCTAAVDDRKVEVFGPSVTYRKEEIIGPPLFARVMNTRDDKGDLRGDIAFPDVLMSDGTNGPTSEYAAQVSYTGTCLGSWNHDGAQYLWTSSQSSFTLTDRLGTGIPDYPAIYWTRTKEPGGKILSTGSTGKVDIITLAVSDGADDSTAASSYAMHIHAPWENFVADPNTPDEVVDTLENILINGLVHPQENRSTNTASPVGPLTVGASVTLTLSSEFSGGFEVTDALTFGAKVGGSVSTSVSIGQSITAAPIPPLHYIRLQKHVHYHKFHYNVDKYGGAGFEGTFPQLIDGDEKYVAIVWSHAEPIPGI
ncbi:MAG TPA: hypothetical protein VGK19_11405 [Capsulimonadaceae bacterium]|jgi:hypothetical protein